MNTIKRNSIRTGKNIQSYNAKHPENPISLRPIRDARRMTKDGRVHMLLISIMNCARPTIARILRRV